MDICDAVGRLWSDYRRGLNDCDVRRLVGLYMVLTGLTRVFFMPIVPLHFMSDRAYGSLGIVLGAGLLAISVYGRTRGMLIRLWSLASAALLVMWAFDLGYRANVFWALILFGLVLFREAVRS